MAKRREAANMENGANEVVETKFFDKTNQQWYSKEGTDKVTFCNSIEDLIGGKGETFTFTGKYLSLKTVAKDDKDKEFRKFFLFVLEDGSFILANKWSEMK